MERHYPTVRLPATCWIRRFKKRCLDALHFKLNYANFDCGAALFHLSRHSSPGGQPMNKPTDIVVIAFAALLLMKCAALQAAGPLVFEGTAGIGNGKHLVFLAGDHEYRSEESLPALARLL